MGARMSLACVLLVTGILGTQARADALSTPNNWLAWVASTPGAATNAGQDVAPPFIASTAPAMSPAAAPAAPASTSAPVLSPVPYQAPVEIPVASSSPVLASTPPPSSPATYDALINMGNAPYPAASGITTGGAQPWYDSQAVQGLFGGVPNTQQQAQFTSTVLQRVEQTFQLSGVPVTLTTDPNASVAHTLSVVSNTSAAALAPAIGMTYLGGDGFSFIDNEAKTANSVDQLEWIVAHNVSHELMLAFGVGEKYDTTGNFVDARNASFTMITSPTATFSPAAAAALNAAGLATPTTIQDAQVMDPRPVPEPATVALWTLGCVAAIRFRNRHGRARAQV